MDYYDFVSLVVFWKEQSSLNFVAVRKLLGVLDDPTIPESTKGDMMVNLLKKFGLHPISYDNIYSEERLGEVQSPKQSFYIHLINGNVKVDLIMN